MIRGDKSSIISLFTRLKWCSLIAELGLQMGRSSSDFYFLECLKNSRSSLKHSTMALIDRQSLTSRIYQHLYSELVTREYDLGSHLNASVVARKYGVSRTTARKAIDQLIDEGWVQVDESRHPVVVKLPRKKKEKSKTTFEFANQTEQVYRFIYEKLRRREFDLGETVKAQQLADELGVSLVTVRQALDWACRDGLFVRIPRYGWQVFSLDPAEMSHIYRCRLLLEPLAIKEAIQYISDETIDELLDECEEIIAVEGNISEYDRQKIDMNFHRAIMKNTNSSTLVEVVSPLIRKRLMYFGTYRGSHQRATFAEEHKAILKALQSRDEQLAVHQMEVHLNRALNAHLKYYEAMQAEK